ncbi:MAG: glycosyltransferase, partial [Nanoarchaeota archaeon]|nr:glycosyltransferase [Nanoarchaeota archaeon]
MVPKISVIMPVYNAEKFLDESIKSILSQTFQDSEFIIINDGSMDNSLKIIKEYARKDKRIILINNAKNLGLQKTLNKGLKAASGRYIARMDADDISLPNRLGIQYNYLEKHPEIFLLGGSAIVIDEEGKRMGSFRKQDNPSRVRKKLGKSNSIIHSSIVFRNEGLSYREKFKTSEDYDFYLRALSSGKKITNLSDFLIKYRISKNSFVSTKPDQSFFYKKAREFYKQRSKEGRDDYNKLASEKIPKEKGNID